ncbi:uncharacterized protein LOC132719367 [Ruditapes philippinarum]|uniref:uncharacterized protein LOC132719367 n=1 Tax=Ruditapes philippinarum TaxID=129788 RepID=UPI00295C31B3|nr:uncharacterized protein LOC132719367 [Ruditapes philippinarum]
MAESWFLTKINVRTSQDKHDCLLTGIAVSFGNNIFVVDYNNDSIKLINSNSGELRQTKLESGPRDIAVISKDELAVTLPDMKTIQFISVSPYGRNAFSLKNKLDVDGFCLGIGHYQGKLAVTFTSPGKLLITNLQGSVQVNVVKYPNGEDIFSYPGHVTTNSNSIYVSDNTKDEVTWFDWSGTHIGRHCRIEHPRGITLLDDGSIFVSDYESRCILKVRSDLNESETALTDVDSPWALCWSRETTTLCVSRFNRDRSNENNDILLYKLM